jgi:hypothetical protein
MRRLKNVVAAVLLAMIASMGASPARAGVGESPGHKMCVTTMEATNLTVAGTSESPGFFDMAIIFVATLGM